MGKEIFPILSSNYPLSCRTPSVHALRWDPWGSCEDSVYCRPYSLFGWGIVGYPQTVQSVEINAKRRVLFTVSFHITIKATERNQKIHRKKWEKKQLNTSVLCKNFDISCANFVDNYIQTLHKKYQNFVDHKIIQILNQKYQNWHFIPTWL